jgi:hypothetical protein
MRVSASAQRAVASLLRLVSRVGRLIWVADRCFGVAGSVEPRSWRARRMVDGSQERCSCASRTRRRSAAWRGNSSVLAFARYLYRWGCMVRGTGCGWWGDARRVTHRPRCQRSAAVASAESPVESPVRRSVAGGGPAEPSGRPAVTGWRPRTPRRLDVPAVRSVLRWDIPFYASCAVTGARPASGPTRTDTSGTPRRCRYVSGRSDSPYLRSKTPKSG